MDNLSIYETTEYLEVFLRNLLLNEKNELYNRNLHISGFLTAEKVDIEGIKVNIKTEKMDIKDWEVDIESVLAELLVHPPKEANQDIAFYSLLLLLYLYLSSLSKLSSFKLIFSFSIAGYSLDNICLHQIRKEFRST